ncbi:hypothetical protein [Peribacillus frigoritolerans]|uniref:hypothetical protein n=1 Tax=Peribacillus frigoritolerans TaxID=450367 RepID=UPI003D036A73
MSKLNGNLLIIITISIMAGTLGVMNGIINLTIDQVREILESILEIVVGILLSNLLIRKKFDDAS